MYEDIVRRVNGDYDRDVRSIEEQYEDFMLRYNWNYLLIFKMIIYDDKEDGNECYCFKVVMLGESGVGKTCIVNRYIDDMFTHITATTGANYSSKVEMVKLEGMTQ